MRTSEIIAPLEIVNRTFEEIVEGMGYLSCRIAQERVAGESPQGINVYDRYRMIGIPGHERLGDQIPCTD